ncbi:MAG: hypothetical protein UU47_C0004G0042 [candidate division TM6 bacterium GW2011_GWE2_41_16]|nr:MAG: hypothetical protein UU47_C0004G0042 [candidate division TM6 bacterium GW2011_GWE2_41_16]
MCGKKQYVMLVALTIVSSHVMTMEKPTPPPSRSMFDLQKESKEALLKQLSDIASFLSEEKYILTRNPFGSPQSPHSPVSPAPAYKPGELSALSIPEISTTTETHVQPTHVLSVTEAMNQYAEENTPIIHIDPIHGSQGGGGSSSHETPKEDVYRHKVTTFTIPKLLELYRFAATGKDNEDGVLKYARTNGLFIYFDEQSRHEDVLETLRMLCGKLSNPQLKNINKKPHKIAQDSLSHYVSGIYFEDINSLTTNRDGSKADCHAFCTIMENQKDFPSLRYCGSSGLTCYENKIGHISPDLPDEYYYFFTDKMFETPDEYQQTLSNRRNAILFTNLQGTGFYH